MLKFSSGEEDKRHSNVARAVLPNPMKEYFLACDRRNVFMARVATAPVRMAVIQSQFIKAKSFPD